MKEEHEDTSDHKKVSEYKPSLSKIPWVRTDLVHRKIEENYYYETSDLVIIALFSGLGGILSTFVGYLGNLVNSFLGVPFGGGQIISGLHVFWIVLIYLLTNRKIGTAFLAGIIKGFVEFFSGSAHGILVILLSGSQGLIIEIVLIIFLSSNNKIIISLASGLSSVSNVLIQQLIFFNSQIPPLFIAFIGIVSFGSGFVIGGMLPIIFFHVFEKSEILNWRKTPLVSRQLKHIKLIRLSIIIILVISEISIFSFLAFQNRYSAQITGEIFNPYTYYPADFLDRQVTVEAELIGDFTHVSPRNYTGVPLEIIIAEAQPISEIYIAKVIASDGYYVTFNSTDIQRDLSLILIMDSTGLRVIAGNFHGSYWINNVDNIEIYD